MSQLWFNEVCNNLASANFSFKLVDHITFHGPIKIPFRVKIACYYEEWSIDPISCWDNSTMPKKIFIQIRTLLVKMDSFAPLLKVSRNNVPYLYRYIPRARRQGDILFQLMNALKANLSPNGSLLRTIDVVLRHWWLAAIQIDDDQSWPSCSLPLDLTCYCKSI